MTTVVTMWCRHEGDNLIGVNGEIPWHEPGDTKHFREVIAGQNVVCGRKTYETFGRTTEDCRFFVFSGNPLYETADAENHLVLSSQKQLEDFIKEEDSLYVAGGAEIYELFFNGKEKFKPQIVVDCIYNGTLKEQSGEKTEITSCVAEMTKKYRQMTPYYSTGQVTSAIWIKKGEFVEQSVLKRIVQIIEKP